MLFNTVARQTTAIVDYWSNEKQMQENVPFNILQLPCPSRAAVALVGPFRAALQRRVQSRFLKTFQRNNVLLKHHCLILTVTSVAFGGGEGGEIFCHCLPPHWGKFHAVINLSD